MSPSMILPVSGSMATPLEVKTKPLAMMAWFIKFDGTAGAFLAETGVRVILFVAAFQCLLIGWGTLFRCWCRFCQRTDWRWLRGVDLASEAPAAELLGVQRLYKFHWISFTHSHTIFWVGCLTKKRWDLRWQSIAFLIISLFNVPPEMLHPQQIRDHPCMPFFYFTQAERFCGRYHCQFDAAVLCIWGLTDSLARPGSSSIWRSIFVSHSE